MVTNSIKAAGYMYLSSNAATKTQNKNQNDFANVMEKAEGNHQNNSAKNVQKPSAVASKPDAGKKASKEESQESLSVQENKKQDSEASEVKQTENEKSPADTVKTETKAETDTSVESEDFTKAAENLVQFQVQTQNEDGVVLNDAVDELGNTTEDEAWQVIKQVLNQLSESLQVSTNDIQASMENLNMDIYDLQEPQNLLKLIVDVKDLKGPEELLTVTELSETFKELSVELKDILKDQTELPHQEYNSSVHQEELSVDVKVSQAMTENDNREASSKEQKPSDSSEQIFSSNVLQDHSTGNPLFVQQTDFNNRVQELLSERMDVQTSESIVKQVLEQVKLNIKTDVTSVQMQLYPEHLGKVAIQVVSKNGVLTAQIAAENESVKAALESQLNTLKESFDNQGLKVQSVEVMVFSRGFDQNTDTNSGSSDNQKQGRRIRKSILDELDKREDEPEEEDLKSALGNTVSYTA